MNSEPKYKWIEGFEGRYRVTSDGRVFSHKSNRFLRPNIHYKSGYHSVMLRTNDGRSIRKNIHRLVAVAFIGPCPKSHEVDHINRNKQHNYLSNLRYVDRGVNMHNRPPRGNRKFKGIKKSRMGWEASICVNHRVYRMGQFKTEESAAAAYDAAAVRLRGRFAVTNESFGTVLPN